MHGNQKLFNKQYRLKRNCVPFLFHGVAKPPYKNTAHLYTDIQLVRLSNDLSSFADKA